MQIPNGFKLLPGPRLAKEGEPAPQDTRQPQSIGVLRFMLPGLAGAWQGEFACQDGKNRPAYLYVCSNHQMFLDKQEVPDGPEPELFLTDLENNLSADFQVNLPPGEMAQVGNNIRYAETCPKDGRYALPKKFTGITFVPPGKLPQFGDEEMKAQLYGHHNGPIQVAVLAIYPAGVRDRLDERLLIALETFSVSNAVPKGKAGQIPGTAPQPTNGF